MGPRKRPRFAAFSGSQFLKPPALPGDGYFVVLMAQLSRSDSILALAEKLRQALDQPFVVEGHELSISCCIGVAVYPEDGTDAITLTKGADDAMYRAKEEGGDCVRLCQPVNPS